MPKNIFHFPKLLLTLSLAVFLAGCASTSYRAPVEDRPVGGAGKPLLSSGAAASGVVGAPTDIKPLPGAENAGKSGYYMVKPGDTLIRIALENGQNWRDLVKWNALDKPNVIEVGQVLRVVAPGADVGAVNARPVASAKTETRPLDAKSAALTPAPLAGAVASSAAASAAAPLLLRESEDEPSWGWPAAGSVSAGFDEQRNKGLAFNGKAGDPVVAAADGRVVYAGSGLRGYGNLVIIKHNATYLTAYAHNQALLVKEDQAVRKGQKIAEMGSTDTDQVKLHFEVRKQGKPIDPAKLLPSR
jgi:lipoprotein NlpD